MTTNPTGINLDNSEIDIFPSYSGSGDDSMEEQQAHTPTLTEFRRGEIVVVEGSTESSFTGNGSPNSGSELGEGKSIEENLREEVSALRERLEDKDKSYIISSAFTLFIFFHSILSSFFLAYLKNKEKFKEKKEKSIVVSIFANFSILSFLSLIFS